MGVFATRSPFRPNHMGLSSVKILGIERTEEYGTVIRVAGADLMDGTPIFDIKPYIPYCDSHPDATGGFTTKADSYILDVEITPDQLAKFPRNKHNALLELLSHDPRPSYQQDSERIYGIAFCGYNIRFCVQEKKLIVKEIMKMD
jgi:hypothetical protein